MILKDKKNLLSIGEMSKFTGAHIKSLRYYEEIGALTPAFVDPDTGYRYYSLDQTYLVEFIQFCIELDIPLKELSLFSDTDDTVNFRAFLDKGKEIAQVKLKAIKRSLKYIDIIEQQIGLVESNPRKDIYTRDFPEKYFAVKSISLPLGEENILEAVKSFFDLPYAEEDYNDYDEFLQYGFLLEHSPEKSQYYVFMELPKRLAKNKLVKVIPGGTYFCIYSEKNQIEQASELFKENLKTNSFIAIQSVIFVGKYKINKPMNELRVLPILTKHD
jgi:DNA-binding transcriptional MerR regulator